MKKVLFMVSSMNIGGVEKSLLSLLSELPNNKYDITVLLLEKKGDFLEYIPEWVKVEEASWFGTMKAIILQPPQQTIKDYIKNKQFFKIPLFISTYFLSKYLNNRYLYYKNVFKSIPFNNSTYDVAITYQGPTDIIDYYIGNRVKATKKISWVHFDISKHNVNKKLYEKLYKKFNNIYVVSKEARERLIEEIPTVKNKAEVFKNLVPTNLIKKMSKETIIFDETYQGIKIVTVGRLSKEKGQDLAIKVLSKLLKNGYEVRWYCIGEGNSRRKYEMLINDYDIKNNFFLLGSTPNPYPYIAKADIYVQTSRHEGYCLTLAEAKCLQKPIITTNFTGAREQLKDGFNGLIVDFDEEDLYKKIKYLIDFPLQRKKLSENLQKNNENSYMKIKKVSL
ncbi:glycosyltransferase [Neobacillus ginsengisoli]|uniref:Glycosyltransferase involved in cell wall biosynthesis n=1 Tax=Neobacillus ginsengisoli TaxID=904295 RepID=A0ABT9XT90_9BACI|nr:glycosyltransferase [Neobacillus ginsengisoli]MDQ0198775.1 glycosyltransferase involved in cell wall biosynthesis [Neobacillus ginsengisoli]